METKWTETGGLHEEQMIFKVFKVCVSSVEVEEVGGGGGGPDQRGECRVESGRSGDVRVIVERAERPQLLLLYEREREHLP